MKAFLLQVLIAFDQLFNAIFGGWADETISSRAWRMRGEGWGWKAAHNAIDWIFGFEPDHCRKAYESERERMQMPPELRDALERLT